MRPDVKANLSDTRGNRLGFAFFRIFMRVFGVVHACRFTAVPAFFYALFDREAFAAARGYLSSRFPDDGGLLLRWRFFRQIMSVGAAMVLHHAVRTGHDVECSEEIEEGARKALADSSKGVVLLLSHVGCWQAALPFVGFAGRRVNLLVQANANANVAEVFGSPQVNLIDNSGPFGGLLDCVSALERGEIVSIMGDREAGDGESSLEMKILGRVMRVPASPWLIAARLGVCVVPVIPLICDGGKRIKATFFNPIRVESVAGREGQSSAFACSVAEYARLLERTALENPYQIYHYARREAAKTKEEEHGSENA